MEQQHGNYDFGAYGGGGGGGGALEYPDPFFFCGHEGDPMKFPDLYFCEYEGCGYCCGYGCEHCCGHDRDYGCDHDYDCDFVW